MFLVQSNSRHSNMLVSYLMIVLVENESIKVLFNLMFKDEGL